MKYLITLLILFTIGLQAQSFERAYVFNDGISWADSLFMTASDSALVTLPNGSSVASDTVKIYVINKAINWIQLTVYDTGATIIDSLLWSRGNIIRTEGRGKLDTVWYAMTYKDTTYTTLNDTIANGGKIIRYTTFEPTLESADLMKIEYINTDWVASRRTKLYWEAVKKKN